ncbi:apolipophorins-like [Liolophura sinensis]|uniref:apolipophorins-like n=1 Tax=Liolophura sinensis TaxID=3198878 RepID=UPI003158851F
MVHRRLQAYREELKARFYDTFPGHILQHSGIREKIIHFVSERIPQYLKSLQKQRPPFTRTTFARKIMPLIEKRLREAKTSFNVSHPFIWEKFLSIPRVSHSARAIATALARNIPRYMRREWAWKTFSFNGILFGDNLVHTFDGQLYRLPEFKLDKCSHLLAADFKDGKFALISSRESITYFSPSTTIRLSNRCKVHLDQSPIPTELPWQSSDEQTSVTIDGGLVDMNIKKWGIKLSCDIHERRTYINLSGFHFNHSLGILGTNDREPSTDFRLPSGQVTRSISKFLNSYELSGDSSCLHDDVPKTCERSSLKKCQEYFQLSSSPLKACFMHINPRQFMESCNSITQDCDVDNPKQLACDLSSAYVKICRQRGILVNEPCGFCGRKSLGDIWREDVQDKAADIVFVISRHRSVAKGSNLAEGVMNIVKKMKYQDDQYGLVTYGSAMLRSQALTHTLGGDMFGSEKDLESALRHLTLDSNTHYPAFEALMKALNFNFRPNAHRMIFLITEWTHATVESSIYTPQMLSLLKNNSITLHIISMYEPLSSSRVVAVRYNDQATVSKGRSLKIALAQDEYTQLLKVSKGSMFYLEKIMTAGKKLLRHFQRYIQEETESNHAGMCRECGCYAGPTGASVTMCKFVKC